MMISFLIFNVKKVKFLKLDIDKLIFSCYDTAKGGNMKRLISEFLEKSGYINLNGLDNVNILSRRNGSAEFMHGDKKYYFKSSKGSGGISMQDKEIFETFISKLLKNYTNALQYFPAIFENDVGVVSVHWDNLADDYKVFDSAINEKAPQIMTSYIDSVDEFEYEYKLGLKDFCNKTCLEGIQKAPIQLMCGNYDFKLSNTAVQCKPNKKLSRFLSFDFGFNLYSLVDMYLKSYNLPLTESNCAFILNKLLTKYFNVTLSFGATKNFNNYEDLNDFKVDFEKFSRKNNTFKKNMQEAIGVKAKLDETINEMKYYHIVMSEHKKELIKCVVNYLTQQYAEIIHA